MKAFLLHYSCIINAPLNAVCAFHTDTRNLPLITPPWIDVMIMSMDVPMREGSVVELRIKRFGIPMCWKMKIVQLDCPNSVVDEMLSGPFSVFHHDRRFNALNDRETKMEEFITLSLGIGFLGKWFFPLIKKDMDKMFAYRHKTTQDFFLNNLSLKVT